MIITDCDLEGMDWEELDNLKDAIELRMDNFPDDEDTDYEGEPNPLIQFRRMIEKSGELYVTHERPPYGKSWCSLAEVRVHSKTRFEMEGFIAVMPNHGQDVEPIVRDCYAHFGLPMFLTWRGDAGSSRMPLPNFLQVAEEALRQSNERRYS